MNGYETFIDDEDLFVEDLDEDLDEGEFLEDFDDDALESDDEDFDERRRRGKRRRRAPRIRAGRTARGRGFFKPRPPKRPVTSSTLQASLERVGRDIRTNAVAIKRLAVQAKSATAKLNSVNNRQDTSINELNRNLKKNANASQQQNQMNMLLPLLQKSPELEARPGATGAAEILSNVQVKKQDNTMALILMMMASQGGGSSSNSMNMMLPMVLLLDK